MVKIHSSEALCAVCSWAGRCIIPEESGDPISTCSYFHRLNGSLYANAEKSSPTNHHDPEWVLGLCRDCAGRNTCMFKQRVGGTWHCEEYH